MKIVDFFKDIPKRLNAQIMPNMPESLAMINLIGDSVNKARGKSKAVGYKPISTMKKANAIIGFGKMFNMLAFSSGIYDIGFINYYLADRSDPEMMIGTSTVFISSLVAGKLLMKKGFDMKWGYLNKGY